MMKRRMRCGCSRHGLGPTIWWCAATEWWAASSGPTRAAGQLLHGGSMGLGLSIGIGVALSRPDRRVIVLDGDGNVLMGLSSLATAASEPVGNLLQWCSTTGCTRRRGVSAPSRRSCRSSTWPSASATVPRAGWRRASRLPLRCASLAQGPSPQPSPEARPCSCARSSRQRQGHRSGRARAPRSRQAFRRGPSLAHVHRGEPPGESRAAVRRARQSGSASRDRSAWCRSTAARCSSDTSGTSPRRASMSSRWSSGTRKRASPRPRRDGFTPGREHLPYRPRSNASRTSCTSMAASSRSSARPSARARRAVDGCGRALPGDGARTLGRLGRAELRAARCPRERDGRGDDARGSRRAGSAHRAASGIRAGTSWASRWASSRSTRRARQRCAACSTARSPPEGSIRSTEASARSGPRAGPFRLRAGG